MKNILISILMFLFVGIMLAFPEDGYALVTGVLSISLFVYGLGRFFYYFRMAKYMVGGNIVLIKSLVIINLGFFTMSLENIPKLYVMLYLVGILMFGGLVDALRAMETKKNEGLHWRLKLTQGIITIVVSLVCLFFYNSENLIVYFYCFGLITSAITRITETFRKTAIVYVSSN